MTDEKESTGISKQSNGVKGGKRPGAGRRKGTPNKATADVKAAAQKYTDGALKTLASIMTVSRMNHFQN